MQGFQPPGNVGIADQLLVQRPLHEVDGANSGEAVEIHQQDDAVVADGDGVFPCGADGSDGAAVCLSGLTRSEGQPLIRI